LTPTDQQLRDLDDFLVGCAGIDQHVEGHTIAGAEIPPASGRRP